MNALALKKTLTFFLSHLKRFPKFSLSYAMHKFPVCLSVYLKSRDYGNVGAEAQQGRLTM